MTSGLLDHKELRKQSAELIQSLNVQPGDSDFLIFNMSGGNQQKALLARCLLRGPKIFILDEPTRGVDVGAKFEIYRIIRDLTSKGCSVIFLSSELPELMGMSDRILVMNKGRQAGILNKEQGNVSAEEILSLAVGA